VEKAESKMIRAAAMSAPNRSRPTLRSTVSLWVRPFISLISSPAVRFGGDDVALPASRASTRAGRGEQSNSFGVSAVAGPDSLRWSGIDTVSSPRFFG
jgi:hypothetical protein